MEEIKTTHLLGTVLHESLKWDNNAQESVKKGYNTMEPNNTKFENNLCDVCQEYTGIFCPSVAQFPDRGK